MGQGGYGHCEYVKKKERITIIGQNGVKNIKMYDKRFSPITVVTLLFFIMLLSFVALPGCQEQQMDSDAGFLVIQGDAVEGKTRLSMDDLKSMEDGLVEADYFSVNSYGTEEYYSFKGIWVWHIIEEKVNLKDHASKVSFIAEDGYRVEYTLEDVKRDDYIDQHNPETKYKMILAWEEDGREFLSDEGNPIQLVVGQKEPGDVNKPYWVRNVKTIKVD